MVSFSEPNGSLHANEKKKGENSWKFKSQCHILEKKKGENSWKFKSQCHVLWDRIYEPKYACGKHIHEKPKLWEFQ